jgi:hypothetical protein
MKTSRRFSVPLVFIAFSLAFICCADMRTDRNNMQIFMRQKLEYSKSITEGIVLEKFDLISRSAAGMRRMSQTNFWIQTSNSTYLSNMTNFQHQLDQLFFAAGDRDLDRTTKTYGNVIKTCVDCHHLVRKEQLGIPRWGVKEP